MKHQEEFLHGMSSSTVEQAASEGSRLSFIRDLSAMLQCGASCNGSGLDQVAFGVHLNSRILCQGIIGLVCALYLIAQPLICSQMCTLSPPQSRVSDMIGTSSEAHSCMRSHHLMMLQSSRDGPCPCNTWTRLKSILLTSKCHCFDIPCRYSSSIGSQKTSCHS